MPYRFLTGRNPPKTRQPREPEPSTINEKTIADFTRVVERLPRVAMSGHSLTLRTSPGRSISAFRVIVNRCRESAAT